MATTRKLPVSANGSHKVSGPQFKPASLVDIARGVAKSSAKEVVTRPVAAADAPKPEPTPEPKAPSKAELKKQLAAQQREANKVPAPKAKAKAPASEPTPEPKAAPKAAARRAADNEPKLAMSRVLMEAFRDHGFKREHGNVFINKAGARITVRPNGVEGQSLTSEWTYVGPSGGKGRQGRGGTALRLHLKEVAKN